MEKVLEDVRCALDIALDTLDALNTVGALDALESATGGSLGIATGGSLRVAIGGIRDHWIRGCFRSRSFSSISCILIYNFTHCFRSSLERTKGNRRASVLSFGVVEGDGITLLFVMESLAWKALDQRSLDDLESPSKVGGRFGCGCNYNYIN